SVYKKTVIIKTRTAGPSVKTVNVGVNNVGQEAASVMEKLSDYFKPEFLNRFDSIIEFNELTKENLVEIVDLMLAELQETIEENDINISITDAAKRELARLGYD